MSAGYVKGSYFNNLHRLKTPFNLWSLIIDRINYDSKHSQSVTTILIFSSISPVFNLFN